jgi:hypothetical protein
MFAAKRQVDKGILGISLNSCVQIVPLQQNTTTNTNTTTTTGTVFIHNFISEHPTPHINNQRGTA